MSIATEVESLSLLGAEQDASPDLMPRDEELKSFTLGHFRFHFRALDELALPPYKGAVLRGGFGLAMREMSCLPHWNRPCSRCLLNGDCAYSYLFETPNTLKNEFLDGVSHAPHPFVLHPPLSSKTLYHTGETFEVGIILIGKALRLVPRVICAFEQFGAKGIGTRHGKFRLETVAENCDGIWKQIYASDEGALSETAFGVTARDLIGRPECPDVREISLEMVTPLRIKRGGALSGTLTFTSVITSLLRRMYLLDHWHCSGRLAFNHKALIELSGRVETLRQDLQWMDWERYSFRQDTKLKMGGLVGSVRFQGPLATFVPYLRLGEAVHIGKGTAFGLGMFTVTSCQ